MTTDPDFVWAKDALAAPGEPGSGPIPRALAAAMPERYKADEKHPVRNTLGQLLNWKTATDPGASPAKKNTTKAEEATE